MNSNYYNMLNPEQRARYDYREEGAGQDDNPYDKETQRPEYDRYAWEMHKIWSEDFTAENDFSRSVAQECAQ